jgi:predicted nucleic acid-binding Zn ribbon protein
MTDGALHRRSPRRLAVALGALRADLEPATVLARVQLAWPSAVGEAIAAAATPVAERDGVLQVRCSGSVWAAELNLLAPQVLAALNAALGDTSLRALRCRTV